MNKLTTLFSTCIAAATLAVPIWVSAAPATASCSVEVHYVVNGTAVESYTKDFVVTRGIPFDDDFSTPTRQKTFTATLNREDGKLVVSIDYFNDVGTFVAISLDTSLRIRGVGVLESTSGSHTFSSSQAVPGGNHTTTHTLACQRL